MKCPKSESEMFIPCNFEVREITGPLFRKGLFGYDISNLEIILESDISITLKDLRESDSSSSKNFLIAIQKNKIINSIFFDRFSNTDFQIGRLLDFLNLFGKKEVLKFELEICKENTKKRIFLKNTGGIYKNEMS